MTCYRYESGDSLGRILGEHIGSGLVILGRLVVFIIIIHFAWKYW
jgi:hypothetical protein